tara:strand:- start:1007 stop:1870 length:864 start_codon:yes stop_codon:yes gene_type:complete
MSTELQTLNVEGMSLAEAMGMSTATGGSQSTLARIKQIHSAITVEDAEGDEKIVVPIGSYQVTMPDGEVVFSKTLTMRLFSQRMQWQRWDAGANTMHKTLLSGNLNVDLKDTSGRHNCGRPSGYIKDFKSLPEEMKSVIRDVKRTKVMLGMIKLDKPIDDQGNTVKGYDEEIPFVMDSRNTESNKAIDSALAQIMAKKLTPVEHTLNLGSAKRDMNSGGKYAVIVPSLGMKVSYAPEDSQTLKSFLEWITNTNKWVEGKHDEMAKVSMSDDDLEMVGSIVEVKEFEG